MKRALEILVHEKKALGGFLYTMQKEGPVLSARYGSSEPPVEMETMVKDYLTAELEECNEMTATANDFTTTSVQTLTDSWITAEGKNYQPAIMSHQAKKSYVVTGLAIFELDPTSQQTIPVETLQMVSKVLAETGDAVEVPAA
jgi:hypothetical protein